MVNRRRKSVASAAGMLLLGVLVAVSSMAYLGSRREVVAEVMHTYQACFSAQDEQGVECRYRVSTTEGTFDVVDSFAVGRFDSSDVFGMFREGETYRFDVIGWHVPMSSTYPTVASRPVRVQR